MIQNECISRDRLQNFSLGFLDEEESRQIEQHLEQCEECDETLAGFDEGTDSLMRYIRQPVVTSRYDGDQEFDDALNRVRDLDLEDQPVTSPYDQSNPDRNDQSLRDYQLANVIGFGGMGTVYQGIHTRLQMPVAVKVLPERRMRDTAAVARFQREMQAIGKLDHPSIVRATDAGEIDGTHYLVMELIEGVDLGRLIKSRGPVDVANACEMIRQAADGLQYAHEIGIVHRDIKPSNLMLSERGQIKILDLGLALLGGVDSPVDELTTIGQLMGTVDYMAPEQCGDSHEVTSQADIYALGATLYKLLSGVAPYSGPNYRTALQKLRAVGNVPIERIEDRCTELPNELANAIHQALEAEPSNRFATVQEFADAITPFANGHDLAKLCSEARLDCDTNRQAELVELSRSDNKFAESLKLRPPQLEEKPVDEVEREKFAQASNGRGDSGRGWWRWLALAAAASFLFFAGIVIYLETGKGTLVIESVADDVEVTIRKADKVYEQLQLKQGENSTRLGSGDYEIELTGASDSLVVETDSFTLKRGDKIVARIREVDELLAEMKLSTESSNDNKAAANKRSDLPIYEGRSIEYWLEALQDPVTGGGDAFEGVRALRSHPSSDAFIVDAMKSVYAKTENELSPKRISELSYMIALMGGERHQKKALEYLFDLVEKQPPYDPDLEYQPGYKVPFFLKDAQNMLQAIDDDYIDKVLKELRNGSSARRAFAINLIDPSIPDANINAEEKVAELSDLLKARQEDVVQALLLASHDDSPVVQRRALKRLHELEPQNSDLLKAVRKMLESKDGESAVLAFELLATIDTEEKVIRETVDKWYKSEDAPKVFAALDFTTSNSDEGKNVSGARKLLKLLEDPRWGLNVSRYIDTPQDVTGIMGGGKSKQRKQTAREFAIERLGLIGDESAIPQLEKELAGQAKAVSDAAWNAIQRIKHGGSDMTPMMEEQFSDTSDAPLSSRNERPLYDGETLSHWLTNLDLGPVVNKNSENYDKVKTALKAAETLRVEEVYRDEILAAIKKWSAIAERERNDDRLGWAATVIGALAGKQYSEEAIDAIYKMASTLPIVQLGSDKQQFSSFLDDAAAALDEIDDQKLNERFVAEISNGNSATRAFTLELLDAQGVEFPIKHSFHLDGFVDYFHSNRDSVIEALLAATHDKNVAVAKHATRIAGELAPREPQVFKRLEELLDEKQHSLAVQAARTISGIDPENENLLIKLSQWANSKSAPTVFTTLWLLEPSTSTPNKARIAKLVELLKDEDWGLNVQQEVEMKVPTGGGLGDVAKMIKLTARERAILLLGQFGPEAKEALPYLAIEADSEIKDIAESADKAIAAIEGNADPSRPKGGGFF